VGLRVKFFDKVIDLCSNFRYMDTSSKFVWLFTNEQVLKKKLVERESCNTKCCKIWINGSKIYFQTKIRTIIEPQALEFRTPPFSSFGPSRDYGTDLCLEVYLWYRVEARIPSLYFDDCFIYLYVYISNTAAGPRNKIQTNQSQMWIYKRSHQCDNELHKSFRWQQHFYFY
jgi:hypothetical protein